MLMMLRCSRLIVAGLVVGAPAVARAQSDAAPPARTLQALRLGEADIIRLDGLPDEALWERAQPASGFLQRDPNNGDPATERTEVRIAYDADRLVLSVICYDREPERVLGNQMQRDRSFEADDRFMWTIDTFLDGRTGYYFEINPAGAMGDGLVDPAANPGWTNDLGVGINRSWDGIWLARVRRTMTGWTAEVEIPFRTVNFDPNAGAWGINFQRTIRRKNEDVLWSGHARNQGLARMTNAGRLEGLGGISQGLGLDVKPYIVGNVSSAPGRGRPDAVSTGDIGVDAFYNLTPALRANISVNTDFAETEVDQRRVNLTRFPLFFEEKRDFFLEGSSFFDFSRESGRAVMPFFSRRIGLDDRGTPQPIDGGAKLTGQAGAFDVGVLQVRTAESGRRLGEDVSVVRVRRRAFEQSYFGGMYTRRSARVPGDVDRHTAGLDFELATSRFRGDQNLELSGFYLWTSSPEQADDTAAYGFRLAYPNDPFSAEIAVREIQPSYAPAVGFVERRGYRRVAPNAEYSWRPRDHPWLRSLGWEVELDFTNDPHNRPLTREFSLSPLEINFEDGSWLGFQISPQYERLEEDFEIHDDVVLPTGAVYRFTRFDLRGSTADYRMFSVGSNLSVGRFFSGERREYGVEMGIRPRRGVALTLEAEHNVLELAEGSFDTDVFRFRADTQFSPWLSVANNLQYDNVSGLLGWQMRFRWIRRPGNDLYLVYTHNWREVLQSGYRRLTMLDNRLATKLVYTLRF
jgi:hypothetical protein